MLSNSIMSTMAMFIFSFLPFIEKYKSYIESTKLSSRFI